MTAEDRFRELVPLAALDALDGPDAAEFREHLRGCEGCRAELAALERVAGAVGTSVPPVAPPPELRARVLGAVAATAADVRTAKRPGSARWPVALAAAAALVLGIGLLVTREQLRRERARGRELAAEAQRARSELADLQKALAEARSVHDLVKQPDSRLTLLAGLQAAPGARARVIWNASTREAVLIASGLQPAPPGKAYEMWVIGEAKPPTPAGVFQPAADGTALVRLPRVEETARPHTFAVTVEPAAGSTSPTGPMVLAGAVS
jgi:anti-sigma-K factor RskA